MVHREVGDSLFHGLRQFLEGETHSVNVEISMVVEVGMIRLGTALFGDVKHVRLAFNIDIKGQSSLAPRP